MPKTAQAKVRAKAKRRAKAKVAREAKAQRAQKEPRERRREAKEAPEMVAGSAEATTTNPTVHRETVEREASGLSETSHGTDGPGMRSGPWHQ